jgi:acetoin utilization protein AcuC
VHEAGRWPNTGLAQDRAGGMARNFPVPQGFNDSEMRWLLHEAILPLIERFRPQAIMLQAGADALEEDPLAKLSLSNNAHFQVVRAVMGLAPRLVVTGGGGYNPFSAGRCWAGIWATLNGIEIPDRATPEASAVLGELHYARVAGRRPPAHWLETLRDAPREGLVREEIRRLAALALEEFA